MGKIIHLQCELDYLIRRPDSELAGMLRGGTPAELRAWLVIEQAKGRRYLVLGQCDNVGRDGACLGHAIADKAVDERS